MLYFEAVGKKSLDNPHTPFRISLAFIEIHVFFYFLLYLINYVCIYEHEHCQSVQTEVQLPKVGSVLPQCESQRPYSGHQAWQQESLSTEYPAKCRIQAFAGHQSLVRGVETQGWPNRLHYWTLQTAKLPPCLTSCTMAPMLYHILI